MCEARSARKAAAKKKEAEKEEKRRHRLDEKEKMNGLLQRAREMNAQRMLMERNEDGTEAVAE